MTRHDIFDVDDMETTRLSLLSQAGSGSEVAWVRLVDLYRPLVYGWLRRGSLSHHDAEELAQEVMSVLVRELPTFEHSGRKGAFRHWLRQITVNRARGFRRASSNRPTATGSTDFMRFLEQLDDSASDLSRQWDREHDQHVLAQLLEEIESEFEPTTLKAFRRQVFDGAAADQVAGELALSVGATYSAKSRVLRKLRQAAEGLVDESLFV